MRDSEMVDICRQMDEVRRSLGKEVEEIVDSARTLGDWRCYVRNYPWICLGGAAALGFLIVPKRVPTISPSAEAIEALARRHKLVVESSPKGKGSVGGMLLGLMTRAAVRGAIRYAETNAGAWLGNGADDRGVRHAKSNH